MHAVVGPLLEKYKAAGEYHMKMPVIDTTYAPDGVGRYTHFENGISIYWSPSTGAHLVYGAIRGLWEQLGWEKSYLGYPTLAENTKRNCLVARATAAVPARLEAHLVAVGGATP